MTRGPDPRRLHRLLIGGALLVLLVGFNLGLDPWRARVFPRPEAGQSTAASLMLEALGEIRTFIAQSLWFESDVYHHASEAHGIAWNQERDIMAIYRMITLLDPRFEGAYDVASFQLVMQFNKAEEGMKFLDEGLANNPDSFTLWFDKGFYLQHLKRYADAIPPYRKAMNIALRPDHWKRNRLEYYNTLRQLGHCFRMMGDTGGEIWALQQLVFNVPTDPYALHRLQQLGQKPVPPAPWATTPDAL